MKVWIKLPTDFHPQHCTSGMVSTVPVEGWVEYVPAADVQLLEAVVFALQNERDASTDAYKLELANCAHWVSQYADSQQENARLSAMAEYLGKVPTADERVHSLSQEISRLRASETKLASEVQTLREALDNCANWMEQVFDEQVYCSRDEDCDHCVGLQFVTDARAALASAKGDEE